MFGMVSCDGDVMPLLIFLHGLKLNMKAYIMFLEKEVLPGLRKWPLEDATSSNRTLQYAIQADETIFGCLKIVVTTSHQIPSRLTP